MDFGRCKGCRNRHCGVTMSAQILGCVPEFVNPGTRKLINTYEKYKTNKQHRNNILGASSLVVPTLVQVTMMLSGSQGVT